MKTILQEIDLADAAVGRDATYAEASRVLVETDSPMVAVLDEERRVVGLFGIEQALRGCMPSYLLELRHTAFAREDLDLLAERAREVRGEPVGKHAADPVSVDLETSAVHVAEVFLHHGLPGIAVVDRDRYVGVLGRAQFARAMLRRALADDGA